LTCGTRTLYCRSSSSPFLYHFPFPAAGATWPPLWLRPMLACCWPSTARARPTPPHVEAPWAVRHRRARRATTPSAARRSVTSVRESTTSTAARRSSTSAVAAHWSCATTALRRLVARTEGAARPHRSPATKSARRVTNEVGRSDSFVSEESLEPASSWHIPYGGQTQTT